MNPEDKIEKEEVEDKKEDAEVGIEEETEKIEKGKSFYKTPLFWTGVILLLILVFFFIGFKFIGKDNYQTMEHNGFEFYKIEDMWYTQVQFGNKLVTLPLRYNPKEVENVQIHGQLDKSFNRKDIYITFDPRNTTETNFTILALGAAELSLSLAKAMGVNTIASCAYDVPEVCQNRPIITCEDVENKSVIMLSDIGTPEILLHGDCVILKGYDMDLVKSIDRFLYQWYAIMHEEISE